MSIQDVRTIETLQRAYMWEIEFQGAAFGVPGNITLYARSAAIPASSVEQIVIRHKAGKVHHAGPDSSSHTLNCAFFDDEEGTVQKFFNDWKSSYVLNEKTGSGGTKSVYAVDMVVRLMNAADDASTMKYRLRKAWPMEIGEISLTMDSSEGIELPVTFSYDTKELE